MKHRVQAVTSCTLACYGFPLLPFHCLPMLAFTLLCLSAHILAALGLAIPAVAGDGGTGGDESGENLAWQRISAGRALLSTYGGGAAAANGAHRKAASAPWSDGRMAWRKQQRKRSAAWRINGGCEPLTCGGVAFVPNRNGCGLCGYTWATTPLCALRTSTHCAFILLLTACTAFTARGRLTQQTAVRLSACYGFVASAFVRRAAHSSVLFSQNCSAKNLRAGYALPSSTTGAGFATAGDDWANAIPPFRPRGIARTCSVMYTDNERRVAATKWAKMDSAKMGVWREEEACRLGVMSVARMNDDKPA